MFKSMTGFGKREGSARGTTLMVEIRSVNHRYREVAIRLPKGFGHLEDEIRNLVGQRCSRGRIDVNLSIGGGKEGITKLIWDRQLAKQYYEALREIQREFKLSGKVDLAQLAGYRDIFTFGEMPGQEDRILKELKRLTSEALRDLETMRRREGKSLQADILKRLQHVGKILHGVEQRRPMVMQEYRNRLKMRVEQLLEGGEVDQGRLAQELALQAERCDITEELTRLNSHLQQFHSMMKETEPVGRKLDFLLQEMSREVNTIGAKANDAAISTSVVQVKSELEKIREQVQNIE